MDKSTLSKAWVELQSLPQTSPKAEELMWAAEEFNLLALRSPAECWELILEVVSQTDDKWVLSNLAAGPLESLLSHHPNEAIVWIEREARKSSKFRELLDDVWQNLMPNEIWARLQLLRD